jgi:Flp pilus assembly protein TadG
MSAGQRRPERGAVTAELALGLPLLVAVTIGLVWLLAVGAAQIRTVDAARETARAVARGDDVGEAVARGRRVAPEGAEVSVSTGGGQVVASSSARVDGPGGLFGFLPAVTVRAEAVAADEAIE